MPCSLFAPVDALPVITTGRNTNQYYSGHEPYLVLNNDPDTYWKPTVRTTIALYIDLGSAIAVDAVSLWLHSYNEVWADSKQLIIYSSSDNVTYTEVDTFDFADMRTAQKEPVVLGKFTAQTTNRYWKVEFDHFQTSPSMLPQVSCVWFLKDCSIPDNYQLPETITYSHFSLETISRAGSHYATNTGVGHQRTFERTFILTQPANWQKCIDAYELAKGNSLPVIIQLDGTSGAYVAVLFASDLVGSKQEHEYWQPTVSFVELGFKRFYTDATGVIDYGEWGITC